MSDNSLRIRVKLEDTVFEFWPMRLTPFDVTCLRRETGFTMQTLMTAIQETPDIDVLAIIVWLARRTNGEKMLKYETVAEAITYASQFDIVPEDDAPAGDSVPE